MSVLKFEKEVYNAQYLRGMNFDIEQLRTEYVRLRKLAFSRARRLEKSGIIPNSELIMQCNLEDLKNIKPSESYNAIAYGLQRAAEYLSSPLTRVSGYRHYMNESLKTLEEHGYEVTAENFQDFGEFMREWRDRALNKLYGSERAVALFENVERLGYDNEKVFMNFQEYLENAYRIEEYVKAQKKLEVKQ